MEFMNKKPVMVATIAAYLTALIYVAWAMFK